MSNQPKTGDSERREKEPVHSYSRPSPFILRASGRYGPCPTVGRFFTTLIGSERDGRDRRNRPDHDRSDGSGRNEETNREVNGCLRFTPHLSALYTRRRRERGDRALRDEVTREWRKREAYGLGSLGPTGHSMLPAQPSYRRSFTYR